jgi:SAM-dependent methyltransferase
MFEKFPKSRIELPKEFRNIYTEHYINNREGKTSTSFLSQKMESWLHKKVAKDVRYQHNKSTLEIGAGTLNQLIYEKTTPYDIVEPFSELYLNSPHLEMINNIFEDVMKIEVSKQYDRIISVATFEHITNLPEVVAKTCLLLKENGVLRVSIPNEGTVLWKLGWKISGIEFKRKYGLDYAILMKYEHVNTADEIDEVLRYFYKKINYSCLGINKKWAFYRFYECFNPCLESAESFLITAK